MHSLSVKTHSNSNYYGQLKSIDNGGNNSDSYSQWQIKSDNVRWKNQSTTTIEADNQRWSPTINDEYASTTYDNRKSAYLLAIRSLAFTFKMADKIDNQTTIDNKNFLPQNQWPQTYSPNRNGSGLTVAVLPIPGRVYSNSNAQRCIYTRGIGQYR